MSVRNLLFVLAFASLLPALGIASAASASILTYQFHVEAATGLLAGTPASGHFAFDSTIIPTGGGIVRGGPRLIDLDFTWDGVAYDETTANTGGLVFDGGGRLIEALFGPSCGDAHCGPYPWMVAGDRFEFSHAGDQSVSVGTAHYSLMANAAPEPSALWLAVIGLIGALRIRFSRATA